MGTVERKQIGVVGVDAGLCWIGDPCYVLHENKHPSSIGKDWEEFCDKMGSNITKQFNYELGHPGLGVCTATGGGDGTFPVYAEIVDFGKHGKRIKSVTVAFLPEVDAD